MGNLDQGQEIYVAVVAKLVFYSLVIELEM